MPEAAGRISLYFRSGDGWYSGGKGLAGQAGRRCGSPRPPLASKENRPAGIRSMEFESPSGASRRWTSRCGFRSLQAISHEVAVIIPRPAMRAKCDGPADGRARGRDAGRPGTGQRRDRRSTRWPAAHWAIVAWRFWPTTRNLSAERDRLWCNSSSKAARCWPVTSCRRNCRRHWALPRRRTIVRHRPDELAEVRFDAPISRTCPLPCGRRRGTSPRAEPAGFHARVIGQWYDDAGRPSVDRPCC